MEAGVKDLFCNECNLTITVPNIISEELLGIDQLSKIEARYTMMRENYDCSYVEWQDRFNNDLKPFRGYTDTTCVTIPISKQPFQQDFELLNKGAIGLDLPIWYNIQDKNKRILIIAQDPLRNKQWYSACRDAVISSPFALHDAEHRKRGNGGKIVHSLICRLAADGYGIYLTDARKYFIYDHPTSDEFSKTKMESYTKILKMEIELVKPSLCVCLGKQAGQLIANMNIGLDYIVLPHLSGTARGAIVKRFPQLKTSGATVDNIAKEYTDKIVKGL